MSAPHSVVLVTTLILVASVSTVARQSAENVAVVINDLSPDSQKIGSYYAQIRGIPASNIFRIQTSTAEVIERDEYVNTIDRQIGFQISRAGLQDRLLYLVLTKGVPLRIAGTRGLTGTESSVDSELTLLYRRLAGEPVPVAGVIDNPYFLGTRELSNARPFTHREHDIYLVTRLDAFTVDDALALVDRAQKARPDGKIVLDQRAAPPATQTGDEWLQRAAQRLSAEAHGDRVVLETTPKSAKSNDAVLGLYTWGANDPEHRTRTTGLKFVPGAIAASLASFDARTFRLPPATWQPTASGDAAAWFEGSADALAGDLIREGITGAAGQVAEAYVRGAVRPEILFPAYLAGFNLAEAFYLSTPTLSSQTVIIGDPLTAPFTGRRLTRTELDDSIDAETGLPAVFSRRRVAAIAAANPDVPESAVAPMVRAIRLLQNDDKAAAAGALAQAVQIAPRVPTWLTTLGSLQEQTGDYASAIATYRDALTIRSDNVVALNNLAFALAVHAGKPAEALPVAERAVSVAPRSPSIIDTLAWTHHLLGQNDEAAKLLSDAIRLAPRHPEIRLHAAVVFAALNQWKQAEAELKEALRLDPKLESRDEVRQLRSRAIPKDY